MNPGGQVHVPEALHTPEPAHGGEQADDWRSRSESEVELVPSGNCLMSGTESHNTTRSVEDPALTAAQTFVDSDSALAERGVEELTSGVEGSWLNPAEPE